MPTLRKADKQILEILEGQAPGYLIHPTSMSFVVEGLDFAETEEALIRLWGNKLADHITTTMVDVTYNEDGDEIEAPVLNDDGSEKIFDSGWSITDKGRKTLQTKEKK